MEVKLWLEPFDESSLEFTLNLSHKNQISLKFHLAMFLMLIQNHLINFMKLAWLLEE